MSTHSTRTPDTRGQSTHAKKASQNQSSSTPAFQFVDNRPEAVAQRARQEMADNSPKVAQLRAMQEMANGGAQSLSKLSAAPISTIQKKEHPVASSSTIQLRRGKKKAKQKLTNIAHWRQRLEGQPANLATPHATIFAEAFANSGVSIVHVEALVPLLNDGWNPPNLIRLIRRFNGKNGGRDAAGWVTIAGVGSAINQEDEVSVFAQLKGWNNASTITLRAFFRVDPGGKSASDWVEIASATGAENDHFNVPDFARFQGWSNNGIKSLLAAFEADSGGRTVANWLTLAAPPTAADQADTVAPFARMPAWKTMVDIQRQLAEFTVNPGGLAVNDWININTEFKEVDETGKGRFFTGRPAKLNELAAAFKATTDHNKKLDIVLKMEEVVESWRKDYVDDGTDNLKQAHAGNQDRQSKLNDIKKVEAQLGHTRQSLFNQVFSTGPANPQKDDDDIFGGGLFELFSGTSTAVSGETSAWKSGISGAGKANAFGRKGDGVAGIGASKDTIERLGVASSGADGLVQIYAFIKAGKEWGKSKGLDKFLPTLKMLEAGAKVAKDTASIGNAIENLQDPNKGTDSARSSIKKVADMDTWAKTAVWTSGLADAISFVKNAAEGIISIYKSFKRKGVDDEQVITQRLQGGISIGKAAQSAIKATDSFLKIADKAIPAPFMQAVPVIGIVVNVASAALAIYQAYKASQREKEMGELSDKFVPKALDNPLLSLAQAIGGISTTELAKITQEEKRGVLEKFKLGKKYLRFNAYVLAKIDEHLSGPDKTADLVIALDGGSSITLTFTQIQKIREYEYVSKMEEINQKRKIKGRVDGIKALVNMTGDIATLSGVGAGAGIIVKSAVSGADLVHKGAKYVQQRGRDKDRADIEDRIKINKGKASGEVAALGTLKDYRDVSGPGFVDKSRKQKETEYRRHARYVLDRVSLIPAINDPSDQAQIAAAQNEYRGVRKLMKATGIDLYDFLQSSTIENKFNTIVKAQKGGR